MSECPLCRSDLSDREFHEVLLADRHGIGDPPADATDWRALQRILRTEYDLAVSVPTLMAHANEHIGYM